MEDKLRFDTLKPSYVVIPLFAILLLVFQIFLRYEYIQRGPVLWRIDRVTREVCRINGADVDCSGKPHSFSTSVSTSTSTSTSTTSRSDRGR